MSESAETQTETQPEPEHIETPSAPVEPAPVTELVAPTAPSNSTTRTFSGDGTLRLVIPGLIDLTEIITDEDGVPTSIPLELISISLNSDKEPYLTRTSIPRGNVIFWPHGAGFSVTGVFSD